MPIDSSGTWKRNVPWVSNGVGTTDIRRSILNSTQLRRAHYVFKSGEEIVLSAEELRRALESARTRVNGSIVGPYSIDPVRQAINGVKVAMRVYVSESPPDLALAEGGSEDEGVGEVLNSSDKMSDEGQVLRAVKARRGQAAFRAALFRAYNSRCALSGVGISDLLEACHISPYKGVHTNIVSNGLLLRADLHTLFDLHLLAFNPVNLKATFHPSIRTDLHVAHLQGVSIRLPEFSWHHPHKKLLQQHYGEYLSLIKEA